MATKLIFMFFGQKTFTEKISNFKMAAAKLQEIIRNRFEYHLKVYILGHTW